MKLSKVHFLVLRTRPLHRTEYDSFFRCSGRLLYLDLVIGVFHYEVDALETTQKTENALLVAIPYLYQARLFRSGATRYPQVQLKLS